MAFEFGKFIARNGPLYPLWKSLYVLYTILIGLPYFGTFFNLLTAALYNVFRLFIGDKVAPVKKGGKVPPKPVLPLKIYEFEACPFCKVVRENISLLDLDVIFYPCPRETLRTFGFCKDSRFRPTVQEIGGKLQFPLLVDDNTKTTMYDSLPIIDYLWKTYGGDREKPWTYKIVFNPKWREITLPIMMALRPLPKHGMLRIPSRQPKQMLELWGYEPSPFVKIVREALTCLELPFLSHSIAKGSDKREDFKRRFGHLYSQFRKNAGMIQVPFLTDPNTGVELMESKVIVDYLYTTYAIGDHANETLFDYGIPEKKKE